MSRRLLVIFLATIVAAGCVQVAASQTSSGAKQTTMFYWCWSAQLTPDHPKVYYSSVFSGGPWSLATLNAAFHNYLTKTYSDDANEPGRGGIGPGKCGSYTAEASAQASENLSITNSRDSDQNPVVSTLWSYGTQKQHASFWYCQLGEIFLTKIFQGGSPDDQTKYESAFLEYLRQRGYRGTNGNVNCGAFSAHDEAEKTRKVILSSATADGVTTTSVDWHP